VLFEQGQLALSRQKIGEGLSLAREQKYRPAEAQLLYQLGEIALAESDRAGARKNHEAALAIRKDMHEDRAIIESNLALANIAIEEGHVGDAQELIGRVKSNLHGSGAKATEAQAELFESRVLLLGNKIGEAAQALARAQTLSASTQRIYLRAMVAITASRIKIAEKQWDPALQDLNTLLTSLQRNGAVHLEFETRLAQCEGVLKSGKRSDAQMCSASLQQDSMAKGFRAVAQKAAALAP
jgi:predicted negative regulator of RcsB-dependent stress response